jgi:hypothetical protein
MNPYIILVFLSYAVWCAVSGWVVGTWRGHWRYMIVPLVAFNSFIGYHLPVWVKI